MADAMTLTAAEQFSVVKGRKKMAVTLRYPRRNDARKLLTYINSLVAEKAMIGKTTKATMREERAYLRGQLAKLHRGEIIHLVAEAEGAIVGTVESRRNMHDTGAHLAEINLGVLKSYRRLGIAKRMLALVLPLSRTHLRSEIAYLTVFANNRPALRLYRNFGFKKGGTLPRGAAFHGKYVDTVMMYKVLA